MIETMNERKVHFVNEIRDFSLLHEIDHSLYFPRLEASFYDDCESSLPLESNVVNDKPLTNLKKVFDHPLASLSFVISSFSSIPMDTSVSDLTLLASPLPLACCMGLEMGEISRVSASVLEDASLVWSKEPILVEPCHDEAPFEELCNYCDGQCYS